MARPTIHIGRRYGVHEGRVDPDAAVAYALATNDPNPACREGDAVPPLYTVALLLATFVEANSKSVDEGAVTGRTGGVHGEHDVYFHAPVEPGAHLRWEAETHSAHQTPAGVLVTHRLEVTDTDGRPLVEHFWSTLLIGGRTEAAGGPPLADHRFPPQAREHPLATERFAVSRDQTFRYAGASNDHAPMHVDDEAARAVGFPSKFLQGVCTLAMCSGAVVKHAAGGDPLRLRRLAARFASPVFPRAELSVELYGAPTADGPAVTVFEARSQGELCISHGRAEVAPAQSD